MMNLIQMSVGCLLGLSLSFVMNAIRPPVLLLLMVLLSLTFGAQAQTALDYPSLWACDSARFHWYCDQQEQKAEVTPPAAPLLVPSAAAPSANASSAAQRIEIKDIKTAEQMRVELKRREDLAIMDPSKEKLTDYLQLWQVVQDKGSTFADSWRRVVWQTPELDYALRRPSNNLAIRTFNNDADARQEAQLRALAKDHGLIFFFKSDCPYCHTMAPAVRMMAERFGIEVLAVTVDGGGLPDFPRPQDGRGKAQAWGVQRVPALFMGSKLTGDRVALGFGVMSQSEIMERMFVLTGTQAGESF